jgi:SDR family mycofactocin-dependent oxidoreductase
MGMLDGKVAFITGGARGQGRAHAVTCAREGADVIIVDVIDQLPTVGYKLATKGDLDETVRLVEAHDRRAIAVKADVRVQDQLDAAVAAGLAELGKIDILIANAGIWTLGSFWELTDEQWDEVIGVNLTGVWKSAKAVAPHMIANGSGSIVITASVNALEAGQYTAHYVAAKHGLIGLMRNVALELAPYGIRCNAVCPGAVKTPMTSHQNAWDMFAGHPGGTEDDMTEAGHHYTLLSGTSWLDPQDVANAALYLNSDLASKVTGATLPVDAGHLTLSGYNPVSTRRPLPGQAREVVQAVVIEGGDEAHRPGARDDHGGVRRTHMGSLSAPSITRGCARR